MDARLYPGPAMLGYPERVVDEQGQVMRRLEALGGLTCEGHTLLDGFMLPEIVGAGR